LFVVKYAVSWFNAILSQTFDNTGNNKIGLLLQGCSWSPFSGIGVTFTFFHPPGKTPTVGDGHLLLNSLSLTQIYVTASKIPNHWPQGKSELCFLETLPLDIRVVYETPYPPYDIYKQLLLDEVEHDIMNYQNQGLCYLPKPKAEADNTDTRF